MGRRDFPTEKLRRVREERAGAVFYLGIPLSGEPGLAAGDGLPQDLRPYDDPPELMSADPGPVAIGGTGSVIRPLRHFCTPSSAMDSRIRVSEMTFCML